MIVGRRRQLPVEAEVPDGHRAAGHRPTVGITGSPLDRADALREDVSALAAAKASPDARLLVLEHGDPTIGADGTLRWQPLEAASENTDLLLLGLDRGKPRFASLADAPAGRRRNQALLAALDVLPANQAAIYATARSLLDWHASNHHCSRCGEKTDMFRAGWGRRCSACGTEHFPRVDPMVIMLAEFGDRVLVGRQPSFPHRRYSALSGFVEPGETIEEAVSREVMEEAGIEVVNVLYVASQPWPFPSSLMIGCLASAATYELKIDAELEDAIWVTRDDVRIVLKGGDGTFDPPPAYTIARTLLQRWAR